MDATNMSISAMNQACMDNSVPSAYMNHDKQLQPDFVSILSSRLTNPTNAIDLANRIESLVSFEEQRTKCGYKGTYDFTKTDEIKRYCLDRLEEIRVINEVFHVPSGFVCIAAFIGFLSRLAYGNNDESDRKDGKWFKDYIIHFMPKQYCQLDEVLYKLFRCGIVHAMSFDPELAKGADRRVFVNAGGRAGDAKIQISHTGIHSLKGMTGSSTVSFPIILNAKQFIKDVESSIVDMFNDSAAVDNAKLFVQCQRPIQRVPQSGTSSGSAQTSSSVDINPPQQSTASALPPAN